MEPGASSTSGRISVALDVACLEPFIPKGEPQFKPDVEEVEKSI